MWGCTTQKTQKPRNNMERLGIDRNTRMGIRRKVKTSNVGWWGTSPGNDDYSYHQSDLNMSPRGKDQPHVEDTDDLNVHMKAALGGGDGIVEHMSLELYKLLEAKQLPNFIQNLEIDRDGGLDRIEETIWSDQKYIWSALLFVFVGFNMFAILTTNWLIFQTVMAWMSETVAHIREKDLRPTPELGDEQEVQLKLQLFLILEDETLKRRLIYAACITGTIEVLYIFWNLIVLLYRLVIICNIGDTPESRFWGYRAITKLCHDQLPDLSTFSAIKLMAKVHPGLIMADYSKFHMESNWKKYKICRGLTTLLFIVSRLACLCLAVSAFAVKMVTVVFKLVDPNGNRWLAWMSVMALLNQAMGVVLLMEVLEKRVFLFIFGGPDTDYQDDERALELVYRCRFVERVQTTMWSKGKKLQAFALLTTFDHFDVQALLLDKHHDQEEGLYDDGGSGRNKSY